MPDKQSRISIITNSNRQSEITEAYKSSGYSEGVLNSAIRQNTFNLRKAIVQRTSGAEMTGLANAFEKQIELEAKNIVNREKVHPNTAAKKAYESIVKKNFETIPGERSVVLMPLRSDGAVNDPNLVEAYITLNSKVDAFKKLNVKTPSKYKNPDDFYRILEKEARWVTNESMTGLQLVYDGKESGRTILMLDKENRPIEKSFKQIMLERPEIRKEEQQELQDVFKKLKIGGNFGNFQ